jgi:hypothetical protein
MLTLDQIERCNALWHRLYARGAVRWKSGMADGSAFGRGRVDDSQDWTGSGCSVFGSVNSDAPPSPDFDDPATLGCLLAMLREASGDQRASVVWYDAARQWVADWQCCEIEADSEPGALLLAIEEATNAK